MLSQRISNELCEAENVSRDIFLMGYNWSFKEAIFVLVLSHNQLALAAVTVQNYRKHKFSTKFYSFTRQQLQIWKETPPLTLVSIKTFLSADLNMLSS